MPLDKGVFESDSWVSMSNMYAIVVNDSEADEFVVNRGGAKSYYYDMSEVGSNCFYNVKKNTLETNDGSFFGTLPKRNESIASVLVDLEEIFGRYKYCPCVFLGNGKNGVLFWREGIDYRWHERFMLLLCVGRPYDYYTVKKFRSWQEFWSWDGSLENDNRDAGVPIP